MIYDTIIVYTRPTLFNTIVHMYLCCPPVLRYASNAFLARDTCDAIVTVGISQGIRRLNNKSDRVYVNSMVLIPFYLERPYMYGR